MYYKISVTYIKRSSQPQARAILMLIPEFYYNCRSLEFSEVFLLKISLILFYTILFIYLASARFCLASTRLAIQRLSSVWSVYVHQVPFVLQMHRYLTWYGSYDHTTAVVCLSAYPGTSSRWSSRQNLRSQSRESLRSRQIQRSPQISSVRSLESSISSLLAPCTWWCNTTVAQ